MIASSDFIASSDTSLNTARFTHFVKIGLTDDVRTLVDNGLCFPFLTSPFLSPLFKLSLVTVFAKTFSMIFPVLVTANQYLVGDFHHVLALLASFRI